MLEEATGLGTNLLERDVWMVITLIVKHDIIKVVV